MSSIDFWEGAATGLVVSLLNHGLHKMADDIAQNGGGKKDSEFTVLIDTDGASNFGHSGAYAGNEQKGYKYVSVEGRAQGEGNTATGGKGYLDTGNGSETNSFKETKTFASKTELNEFLGNRYEQRLIYKVSYNQAINAIKTVYNAGKGYYHFIFSSCVGAVKQGLESIGVNVSTSVITGNGLYKHLTGQNNISNSPWRYIP